MAGGGLDEVDGEGAGPSIEKRVDTADTGQVLVDNSGLNNLETSHMSVLSVWALLRTRRTRSDSYCSSMFTY